MYTFYEYPKCSTCRKAKAELNQLGLDVEYGTSRSLKRESQQKPA